MQESVLKTVHLIDDEIFKCRIGPLSLFLKKQLNDMWIASSRDENRDGDPEELPEIPDWQRIALPEKHQEIQLNPVFPDRSVVIDTENIYRVFRKARSRVYCRIPVFIRVTPKDRDDVIIAEIPTVILSNTWFGDFTEGELSYALSSTARRVLHKELFDPHLVVCPMEINNQSENELRFEKMCLRVDRLSIYVKDGEMWADETLITHHGRDSHSDIEMKGVVPVEAKGALLLSRPRTPVRRSVAVRTFKILRDISVPGF